MALVPLRANSPLSPANGFMGDKEVPREEGSALDKGLPTVLLSSSRVQYQSRALLKYLLIGMSVYHRLLGVVSQPTNNYGQATGTDPEPSRSISP